MDIIAKTSDGKWAPIEVKFGNHGVEHGAKQLQSFLHDVDLVLPLDTLAP